MSVMQITEGNWDQQVVSASVPVLVVVTADWCGHCRRLHPILNDLAEEANDEYRIGTVEASDRGVRRKIGRVHGLPTLCYFSQGRETTRQVGFQEKRSILRVLNGMRSKEALFSPLPDAEQEQEEKPQETQKQGLKRFRTIKTSPPGGQESRPLTRRRRTLRQEGESP